MKRILTVLLAFSMVLDAFAAPGGDKLPRAEATETQKAEFHKMFPLVWGHGTDELHALMVLKDGKVIYEETGPAHTIDQKHVMWSASKTFTAVAVGFAMQDGLLKTSDRMVDIIGDLCPEDRPEWMDEITVWHLLTMSAGIAGENSSQLCRRGALKDWAREILASPMHFKPGEYFQYNSMESYMLSAIISRVTGERLDKYLEHKLFEPLGITDWWWEVSPQDYAAGGWGLFISAESLAKMGQFMLQKGVWNGERLLYEEWFDEAMSPQIMQDKNREKKGSGEGKQGYGYQLWCCTHGAYRIDGAWGQYAIIIPEKNAVVVILEHSTNTSDVFKGVWNYIYPNL